MLAVTSITDEILDLKKVRKAILLAHHYQAPEVQEFCFQMLALTTASR